VVFDTPTRYGSCETVPSCGDMTVRWGPSVGAEGLEPPTFAL
jgi:hypothetical protein